LILAGVVVFTLLGAKPDAGRAGDGKPGKVTNSIGMDLVKISAGTFLMGSPKGEEGRGDDEVQHEVKISRDFYLGVYEVTQAQYEKVMGANPSHFSEKGAGKPRLLDDDGKVKDASKHPVEQVSWEQAKEFCKKLSELAAEKKAGRVYRLPTEAEWEYACRAGAKTPFHHGKKLNIEANFCGLAPYPLRGDPGFDEGNTIAVGYYTRKQFPDLDMHPFGLFDMHGNVHEWCEDWYGPYAAKDTQTDPRGPETGKERVFRGGCWLSTGRACRAANRNKLPPTETHYGVGFRVVFEMK
jgi:formylglycine-generating enzyme required for sulfatase activity